jgi:DNA invertase Pin-like site-specific DNA recombinase
MPALTQAQQTAIELLAAGERDHRVADAIKVSRMTVYRWKHDCHTCRSCRSTLALSGDKDDGSEN